MKKMIPAIVVAVIFLGGGAYAIFHKSDKKSTSTNTTTTTTNSGDNTNNTSSTGSDAVATNEVTIKDLNFSSANITVKKGTKVTWTNSDSTAHTVTGESGGPASSTLNPGDTYSFTFNTAGKFGYHCNFHSSMIGTVVVE